MCTQHLPTQVPIEPAINPSVPRSQTGARREAKRSRRLETIALYLMTILAAVTMMFLLPRFMPGDPLSALLDPESNITMTAEARERIEAHYGLNRPLFEQYADYLGDIATLDFGWSISFQTPVWDLIKSRAPWTALLMSTSLFVASTVSYVAGVMAGWRRGSASDRAAVSALTVVRAIPEYAIAAALLILLAVLVPVFPVAGSRTLFMQDATMMESVLDVAAHLVLPATALTLGLMGSKFLLVRNTVIGTLGQEYMLLARAKGLPERRQQFGHAGRNALLPFLAILGIQAGFAVGGTIFVETVFTYPGMGTLILSAVEARDYPLLEALFVVLAAAILLANLIIDLISAGLDPDVGSASR